MNIYDKIWNIVKNNENINSNSSKSMYGHESGIADSHIQDK